MNAIAEPATRAHTGRRRLVVVVVGLVVPLALQWLLVAIPVIETEHFDRSAVELDRRGNWRYGYVQEHHGATLVRTPLRADAPPLAPRLEDALVPIMARELRTTPWKAGLELCFYACLLALYRYGLRRFAWARASAQHRWRRSPGVALSTAVFVSAAMAPYLATGYGEPLFSNRWGPGALSYSGLVPVTAPITPAVSYGLLIEAVLIWPLMATQWAAEPLSAWLGIRGSLWLVSAGFWGIVAAAGAWVGCCPTPVKERCP